ncbi:hypothetical protein BDY21DRAFT_308564 [Lineolata rhizophorae]|uniref:BTB domain-containing protein n=1 Tax=Lineolata rhizophorae TaxID=578093 RepID=A0A6A6NT86_9PEZI|nr:hypothetical protein BDY21DRAFT_308564 [Lineolata rhizophorae]
MVRKKHEIEAALHAENQEIKAGRLKEENPLDVSPDFEVLCEACRRGDLKLIQEKISAGVNINARDRFDYTPLILASLCGQFEVAQLLLESGAQCERDTFQGERCLYNALTDRLRNLLLSYDYSKATHSVQPLAAHISALLTRNFPQTSDVVLVSVSESIQAHKFVLAARSPYFARKLATSSSLCSLRLSDAVPPQPLKAAVEYLYFEDVQRFQSPSENEEDFLNGLARVERLLEIENLFENTLDSVDRRVARQKREEELERGQNQLEAWFRENVIANKIRVNRGQAPKVRWNRENSVFADVLLQADEEEHVPPQNTSDLNGGDRASAPANSATEIANTKVSQEDIRQFSGSSRKSVLFPAHRAMLIRSEYFLAMFSSAFREAQDSDYLHVIKVACSPEVLEIVLSFLYAEKADFSLEIATDVLFAADLLFIDKLKVKAATVISTLGYGNASTTEATNPRGVTDSDDVINIYDIVRAGWATRVHRLEEFGARYIAQRMERFIDEEEFEELVAESAGRIQHRQETDTVELIDDIRYYLSERFRLRFEDSGLDEMMDETVSSAEQATPAPEEDASDDAAAETQQIYAPEVDGRLLPGAVRTLDGEAAGDEFTQDAINYQILLRKIDDLLDRLKLEA